MAFINCCLVRSTVVGSETPYEPRPAQSQRSADRGGSIHGLLFTYEAMLFLHSFQYLKSYVQVLWALTAATARDLKNNLGLQLLASLALA